MDKRQVWQLYGIAALVIVLLQMSKLIPKGKIGVVWVAYGLGAVLVSFYLHLGDGRRHRQHDHQGR